MEETGADGRGVADDGYQIALAARLHPQDPEAACLRYGPGTLLPQAAIANRPQ